MWCSMGGGGGASLTGINYRHMQRQRTDVKCQKAGMVQLHLWFMVQSNDLWESSLKFVLPVFPNLLGFQFSSTLLGLSSIRAFTVILLLLLSADNSCTIPHRSQVWPKTDHQCCEGTRCLSANTSAQTAMAQKSIRVMYMKCSRPGSFWASANSESVCICVVCVLVCVCVCVCVCVHICDVCMPERKPGIQFHTCQQLLALFWLSVQNGY